MTAFFTETATMAVRSCTAGGFITIAKRTLAALIVAGGIGGGPLHSAFGAEGLESGTQRSVLVKSKGVPGSPNSVRILSDRVAGQPGNEGLPPEQVQPEGLPVDQGYQGYDGGQFDPSLQDEGVMVAAPDQGIAPGVPFDGSYQDGSYQDGYGDEPGPLTCGTPGCQGQCDACRSRACGDPAWRFNANCEPPGLFQKLFGLCGKIDDEGLWTGRADALFLSRNAPSSRPLYVTNPAGANALNANQLESITAVGPRVSLFRRDAHTCDTWWEGTYLYSGGFTAQKTLPFVSNGYNLASPGIYGVLTPNPQGGIDAATARLVSSLQSAELNRRWALGSCTQLLAGFRWIQWQESLAISDAYALGTVDAGADFYNTSCVNDLYGGQIGLDTLLWQPAKCFRLEGLVKAGAYYNNATQTSSLSQPFTPYGASASVGQSPATCAFTGEVGLTGVVPICCNLDFRFGYFGLWLTSIAQPSNQLSGQNLDAGDVATIGQPVGSLNTSGAVVLQGLSLGLEGRW